MSEGFSEEANAKIEQWAKDHGVDREAVEEIIEYVARQEIGEFCEHFGNQAFGLAMAFKSFAKIRESNTDEDGVPFQVTMSAQVIESLSAMADDVIACTRSSGDPEDYVEILRVPNKDEMN